MSSGIIKMVLRLQWSYHGHFRAGIVALAALLLLSCQSVDMARFHNANARASFDWLDDEQVAALPFTLVDNHIVVPVRINGSEPLDFVLDSGAAVSVILESRRTRELSLPLGDEVAVSGAGIGEIPVARIAENVSLGLGALQTAGQSLVYLPVDSVPFFDGVDDVYFDGVLGATFFERLLIKVDYDEELIVLADPASGAAQFGLSGEAWRALPISIESGVPFVNAEIGNASDQRVAVKLLVDTGARGLVSLTSSSHPALAPPDDSYPTVSQGLSGEIIARVAILPWLEVAGHRFRQLPVEHALSGGVSDNSSNGVLSNEVLNRFNLVFDYPNERLFLTPNHRYSAPLLADRSGLQIRTHSAGGIVRGVAPGSAGDQAGLTVGDVITSFDGTPVTPETITLLKRELASPRKAVGLCWRSRIECSCADVVLASRFSRDEG